jgi:phospholipase C
MQLDLLKNALTTVALTLIITSILSGTSLVSVAAVSSNFSTTTPIKHLVIIFQENVSFDHYFATYPNATNPSGELPFHASPNTPSVNGLFNNNTNQYSAFHTPPVHGLSSELLTHNPNLDNPFRIARSNASTCSNAHSYTRLQEAYNGGLMDKFVQTNSPTGNSCKRNITMGYFDGNTVTALWNYAQHFAISDNFFGSTFGPSTPGALNLVSGQTHGATPPTNISDNVANGSVIGDPRPTYDDCSKGITVSMNEKNIGNLLNSKNITWGWFQGGFKPTGKATDGKAICNSKHQNINGTMSTDYIPHHEPFQYYNSTSNPPHLPPTFISMIGKTDQANHQYDLTDFWNAAESGNLPSVSFLKAAAYQDGHAGYSDPLDEQHFLVDTINRLQKLAEWNSTAVIIAYDDSDGWYDHVMPPIISQSNDPKNDALLGKDGLCGQAPAGAYQDRCGYGPRLPFLVISPYAKVNYVDHQIIDQTSIIRFIEDNWGLKRIGDQSFDVKAGSIMNMFNLTSGHYTNKLFLDPLTGIQK